MAVRNHLNLITPKTLTAASPGIIADPGDGYQVILVELLIKNTDSEMRSVEIGDGTTVFGEYEIEPLDAVSIGFDPDGRNGWFAAASTAIIATPSADNVLKVASGKYIRQQVSA